MLPLAPTGSLELQIPGETISGKSDWSVWIERTESSVPIWETLSMYFQQKDKRVMKEFRKCSIWRVRLRIQSIYHKQILKRMKGSKNQAESPESPEFKHLQIFPAIIHVVKTEQNKCLHKEAKIIHTKMWNKIPVQTFIATFSEKKPLFLVLFVFPLSFGL